MAESGENLERFLKYVENERDTISDRIREFQLAHRDNFKNMDSSCEYRHEHADIYNKYISLLESFSEHFKEEQGLTDDDLLDMVRNLKESSPEMWSPFQVVTPPPHPSHPHPPAPRVRARAFPRNPPRTPAGFNR